jgi:thiol:disulfide interchange protein DsbA
MTLRVAAFLSMVALALVASAHAAPQTWSEGRHYTRLSPVQRTSVPDGKVEVMEVFSYGCIACNGFQPVIEKLQRSLPSQAQLVFLPASFNEAEDWPLFQRAYFAAQRLGIAESTHQALYDAVWKTGELAIIEPGTRRLNKPQPSLLDAAHCYQRLTGVKPEKFLEVAKSFTVETRMKAADDQVAAMQVPGTPCIVVNGKYRVNAESLRTTDELIELVKYLVAMETH